MNDIDKEWIQKCIAEPEKYRIVVDNDGQWVEHIPEEELAYSLCDFVYGWEFALELLKFMGCNAESV